MKGLYIHIPFCVQKCKYCDFTSYANCEDKTDIYLNALIKEMHQYNNEKINTIFIGGGTPSLLSCEQISFLMDNVYKTFNVAGNCEITMELNPGTLNKEKIQAMYKLGFNRVSVGVQSFNDNELKAIGRIHRAHEAYNNIWLLNEAGVKNINLDIMSALPYQSKKSLMQTLKKAVSLPITHISAYSLILEEGTPLFNEYNQGKFTLPSDDEDRDMYASTVSFLKEHGFMRYEISNFAKKGYECKHNLKYWHCDEYIGLGASAHSYIGNERFSNTCDLSEYISGDKREVVTLTKNDKMSEFMMMSLRTQKGVDEIEFKNRFDIEIKDVYKKEIDKFLKLELLEYKDGFLSLTDRGIDISNSVMCEFIIN